MAFPVVEATAVYTIDGSPNNHDVTLPSGIESGDLLVMCLSVASGAVGTGTPTGWTLLASASSGDFNGERAYLRVRTADGTEGSTVNVPLSTFRNVSAVTYRISGADHANVEALFASTIVNDPPSITASWGSDDNLFLAGVRSGGTDGSLTSEPTNYAGGLTAAAGNTSNTNRVRMSTAQRNLAAASDDPGAFTISDTVDSPVSFTIVIGPAAGGGTTVTGDASVDDVTVSSTVSADVSGDASVAVDAATVSSVVAVDVSGDADIALADATLSSDVGVEADASAAIQLDDATVSSTIADQESTAQADITLDGATLSSEASAALDASAELATDSVELSALASALADAVSTITLDGATVSSEVVTEARDVSAELSLDGFTLSGVISGDVQVVGGGGSSRPKRPNDWNPTPYERKGLDKISEAAKKRRLIEAARAEDEFLLAAVKQLLVEAA